MRKDAEFLWYIPNEVRPGHRGDSAADPEVLPLLLGLGLRTFSVGAARLPQVAAWIAGIDTAHAADQAAAVLSARPVRPA